MMRERAQRGREGEPRRGRGRKGDMEIRGQIREEKICLQERERNLLPHIQARFSKCSLRITCKLHHLTVRFALTASKKGLN